MHQEGRGELLTKQLYAKPVIAQIDQRCWRVPNFDLDPAGHRFPRGSAALQPRAQSLRNDRQKRRGFYRPGQELCADASGLGFQDRIGERRVNDRNRLRVPRSTTNGEMETVECPQS